VAKLLTGFCHFEEHLHRLESADDRTLQVLSKLIKRSLTRFFAITNPVVLKVCSADLLRSAYKFAGDPWIHFCNGYFEIYLFFNWRI